MSNFDHHLFISYAHVDNMPTSEDGKGWVTRFHECLESYLSHSIGGKAKIWRDTKLRGNDEFGPEIELNLPKSATLLSILSPRYFESDWCVKEVNKFCEYARASAGLDVGNKVRVFRVLTRSFSRERFDVFPDLGDKATGYEFFQEDERERQAWLDPDLGSGEEYRRRIYYLADEIAGLVRKLESVSAQLPYSEKVARDDDTPTVYLAECSYDRREDREKIAGTLRGHGYRILPENRLSDVEAEYKEEVVELLNKCQLSVHIIGASYGTVLDGPSRQSKVTVQNELAATIAGSGGLKRLIWIPRSMTVDTPRQQEFIELLRKSAEAQRGADLIEADLETLKGTMHRTLTDIQSKSKDSAASEKSEGKSVYVVCAQRDRSETLQLRKFLMNRGYTVKIPVFEGDAATVRRANETNFRAADAVILFYGQADEAWRATTENELTRMRGLREGAAMFGSFTYLAGPETVDKTEMIELDDGRIINGLTGLSEDIMADFLISVPV